MDRLLLRGGAARAVAGNANTGSRRRRCTARGWLAACAALALAGGLAGCTLIDNMMPSTKRAKARSEQLHDLQLSVMRFADEYVGRTSDTLSAFQQQATPEARLQAQDWKVAQATAAYTIASGPNPVGNALDMVVLASLSNMEVHAGWVDATFGERVAPVRATYAALEPEAWELLKGVLDAAQQEHLRKLMAQWRAAHPTVRAVSYIRFRDFAESVGAPVATANPESSNLFAVLGLDPLSGLDPAVREITQSRELAERAIYYMQRAPLLLDMQIERLACEFAVMPETQGLLADMKRASLIGTASSELVSNLPGLLDRQREALYGQMVGTLHDEGATIGKLAGDLRATLEAGTQTATALQGTIAAVEHLKAQFAASSSSRAEPSGPPFDIRQYTEMLRQATETSRELSRLAQSADALVPALRTVSQVASGDVDRILDRVFRLALTLVLVSTAAILAAVLAYRRFAPRL